MGSYQAISASNTIPLIYHKGSVSAHYEIHETLGEGSFGTVRRVSCKNTQKSKALKTIPHSLANSSDFHKTIEEVEILRKLRHPNILKVQKMIEDSKNVHIVTELYTGGELFELVSENPVSQNKAVEYMKQLLSALEYIHHKNILHTDIKLDNVMLKNQRDDSPIVLIDFGESKYMSDQRKIQAKSFYSPPETFKGIYNKKSEVWSCGVIFYTLVSGYMPTFANKNQLQFPKDQWEFVSDFLIQLIASMMDEDFNNRVSVEEALKALQKWSQNIEENSSAVTSG